MKLTPQKLSFKRLNEQEMTD